MASMTQAQSFNFDYTEAYVLNDWDVQQNGGSLLPLAFYVVDDGIVIAKPDPAFDPAERHLVYKSLKEFRDNWSDVPFIDESVRNALVCYEAAVEGSISLTAENTDPAGWKLLEEFGAERASRKKAKLKAAVRQIAEMAARKKLKRQSGKTGPRERKPTAHRGSRKPERDKPIPVRRTKTRSRK